MSDKCVATTCPYCGVGCGVSVTLQGDKVLPVSGDSQHPANEGRLCVKGSALHETLSSKRRLLHPLVDGQRVDWDGALDTLSARLQKTLREHGPQSVALYLSGQLLTEDYYVANKLWKGFIGSANVDTNSRLCMSSAVVAHQRAFGEDVVPGCYADMELSDLTVLVGSNAAWAHPVLYQRMLKARAARPGTKLVVVDPRRTDSCDQADLHLAIRPGSDAWLFNGLLVYLADHGHINESYLHDHTRDFAGAIAAARGSSPSIEQVARYCDVDAKAVALFYQWFAENPRTVTLFSQGINQSSSGTDKGNAIINCHLATGRVGQPGASPFSITGQPNAMGGREVGGLANQLAVHRGFGEADIAAVGNFWQAANIARQPGLKALDLFEAIERGEIKFLWVLATNPLVSLPEADRWRRALENCETVVVSDCVADTDTTAVADILLPACGWGEKDGTVTNSERCISRQRAFLPASGEARPDWWALSQLAARLGFADSFDYDSAHSIFSEHAALSGINRDSPLQFDISELAAIDQQAYDSLQPFQWPLNADNSRRLYSDGRFSTADGRARFVAIAPQLPQQKGVADAPFILNTGRVRDHWHTMTRTAESTRLNRHRSEPYVELHPQDADSYGLSEGDIAELGSEHGGALLRVRLDPGQRPGSLFVPMHWSSPFAARARVDALVGAVCDPHSGQPELKHARVSLRRWPVCWQALLISEKPLALSRDNYWAAVPVTGGWLYWLAGADDALQGQGQLMALLPGEATMRYEDAAQGELRLAWLRQGQLQAALLFGSAEVTLPDPWWLADRLGQPLEDAERRVLLSARPPEEGEAQGAIICSCFQVGMHAIEEAIAKGADSAETLGSRLSCGTNCGSCVPELNRMLREATAQGLRRTGS